MVDIKDGVYGFVSGTVGRSFTTKNGRAFVVEVKDQKQQYPDRWTVWGDLPVSEGDLVTVEGWLSAVLDSYEKDGETKQTVRRSVNKPKVKAHEPLVAGQAGWDAGVEGQFSDATPF